MTASLSQQKQFLELRAQGLSYRAIADKLGVSKTTLLAWSRKFQPQIDQLYADHIEGIYEECAVSREKRVRDLATIYHRVRTMVQADALDLTVPSNRRLLELFLRFN